MAVWLARMLKAAEDSLKLKESSITLINCRKSSHRMLSNDAESDQHGGRRLVKLRTGAVDVLLRLSAWLAGQQGGQFLDVIEFRAPAPVWWWGRSQTYNKIE